MSFLSFIAIRLTFDVFMLHRRGSFHDGAKPYRLEIPASGTESTEESGFFGVRAASGIPRDAAFARPRKAVPRSPSGSACHRTPKRSQYLIFFVIFVCFVGKKKLKLEAGGSAGWKRRRASPAWVLLSSAGTTCQGAVGVACFSWRTSPMRGTFLHKSLHQFIKRHIELGDAFILKLLCHLVEVNPECRQALQ